jgi:hypothetical protein
MARRKVVLFVVRWRSTSASASTAVSAADDVAPRADFFRALVGVVILDPLALFNRVIDDVGIRRKPQIFEGLA